MKALGASFPAVSSGGCSGSLKARTGRWNASTKPPARPVESNDRREIAAEASAMIVPLLRLAAGSGLLDGGPNAHIRPATADISRHGRIDVCVIGVGRRIEQGGGRHDLS